jgi:hypothetical protein
MDFSVPGTTIQGWAAAFTLLVLEGLRDESPHHPWRD